jgi:hypothetical protein
VKLSSVFAGEPERRLSFFGIFAVEAIKTGTIIGRFSKKIKNQKL